MPRFHCFQCNKDFANGHSFEQHNNAPRNRLCFEVNVIGKKPGIYSTSHRKGTTETPPDGEEKTGDVFDFVDDTPADNQQVGDGPDDDGPVEATVKPDSAALEDFRAYVDESLKDRKLLPTDWKCAIELMHMMDKNGGSLSLFNQTMEWHCSYQPSAKKITSDALYKFLVDRYNLKPTLPFERRATLPHSKVEANIPCHDAQAQFVDLLTDPRIRDEDYLFHENDPTKGPPEEFKTVSDINTGRCYRATYDEHIRQRPLSDSGRHRVLLPIIIYLDGCNTGSAAFSSLSIEILKVTFGIFNLEFRDKPHAWRALGYVQKIQNQKGEAQKILRESEHSEAANYLLDPDYLRRNIDLQETPDFDFSKYQMDDDDAAAANGAAPQQQQEPQVPEIKAQDLHKMLQMIFASYKEMQDRDGFDWDLPYRGMIFLLQFVPFIIFIKGDTQEHDKLCGKYIAYGCAGQKCHCRYCCVPTAKLDMPYADFPRKTVQMIMGMIRRNDTAALKKISQHNLFNSFYELRFGSHNDCGIHGACPLEILHWILLGMYKYSRGNFFIQCGEGSKLTEKMNALILALGILLQRQSDKDMPRTTFSRGAVDGVLMGHEMTGFMLLLSLAIRCTKGQNTLLLQSRGKQKEFLGHMAYLRDWQVLVETQLQFEAWLRLPKMEVADIERSRVKVCEVMNMTKQIGKRTKGMKCKNGKFHMSKHVPDDCLDLGPPSNVNTSSNESNHKPDKRTAQRTNK